MDLPEVGCGSVEQNGADGTVVGLSHYLERSAVVLWAIAAGGDSR